MKNIRMIESLVPAEDFPGLKNLTYFDCASVGIVPLPVLNKMLDFQTKTSLQGTVSFGDREESQVYDGTRASVAKLLSVPKQDVAILTSATECIAQIAWWVRPKKKRDFLRVCKAFQ
ncbi:cysteine desulfurase [bacterium]|nr:cysteine desulfurase [bacterium]